jgi:hypothetical protein
VGPRSERRFDMANAMRSVSDIVTNGTSSNLGDAIRLTDVKDKPVVITAIEERDGQYGSFYVCSLKDGRRLLASGKVVSEKLAAISESLPVKATFIRVQGKQFPYWNVI